MNPLQLRSRGHRRGIVKRPQCPKTLCIKLGPCTAPQARPVTLIVTREGPCQTLVLASENLLHEADLFSESIDRSIY